MRRTRIVVASVVLVAASWSAPTAGANGGAYITFDETYYVPGDDVTAEVYVSVPAAKSDLLDRGPFWLYALPSGSDGLKSGEPVPASAIPLATLDVNDEGRGQYELTGSFVMPEAAAGEYEVSMCNDPCTLTGFGEPVSGVFILARSQAEIELLRRNEELIATVGNLERTLRKERRDLEELDALYGDALAARDHAQVEADDLRDQLAAERSVVPRPLIDPWAAVAAGVGLTLVALALVVRRRGRAAAAIATGLVLPVTLGAAAASPASAGGGSSLQLRDVSGTGGPEGSGSPPWAAPGAVVTFRGPFWWSEGGDPIARGPWVARLVPEPKGQAVPLGPVAVTQRDDVWLASLRFEVPLVRPGTYRVEVCDAGGCDSSLGDLVGTRLIVAGTRLEASLIERVGYLEYRLDAARRARDRLERQVVDVEHRLETIDGLRADARADAASVRDELGDHRARGATLDSVLRATADDRDRWRFVALIAVALAIVAFAALMATRGRRSPAGPAIPDTPEELLETAGRT